MPGKKKNALSKEDIITINEDAKKRLLAYAEALDLEAKEKSDNAMQELRTIRKNQKLTQGQVSELTGIATPNIARLEACKSTATLAALNRYANALGYDIKLVLEPKQQKKN